MCGLVGIMCPSLPEGKLEEVAQAMALTLRHRGPDDSGSYSVRDGIALGHRRLSIIDVSASGHQPMRSSSGRFVITFNGEIYNYRALRKELRESGHAFRGESDTEVLLGAFEEWGIEGALQRAVGMFALALWDTAERKLTLARDRLGEKPLYYGWGGGAFLFGSELKACKAAPGTSFEIARESLALYVRHNYIPAPFTIYKNIWKLPPGTWLTLSLSEAARAPEGFSPFVGEGALSPRRYWSLESSLGGWDGSHAEAETLLDARLSEAVSGQMISDVPLGAFLSGGIDSSLIVALMQRKSSQAVRTFSIGFSEELYNEARYAKRVAEHLGTQHTEFYVSPLDALQVIPKLPSMYDEPFADSSQIPTALLCSLARQHVTVSLSGDGGDELFGGYERYAWSSSIWGALKWLPRSARALVARMLRSPGVSVWDTIFNLARILPFSGLRVMHPGEKVMRLAELLGVSSREDLYVQMVSQWTSPLQVVQGTSESQSVLCRELRESAGLDYWTQMMRADLISYLPDDIMVKVDRASMAASLETRAPFLDHRVVELAFSLPLSMKVNRGVGKSVLRNLLYRYVPRELVDRPKMGFGVPLDRWLREDLRPWAEELLSENRLRNEGFFNPGPIRQRWEEHLSGDRSWHYPLWTILMFQAWWEEQRGL